MDVGSQGRQRQATVQKRRAPGQPLRLVLPFDEPVLVRDDSPIGPIELDIETTNDEGEFAAWLDDAWWAEAITHWADDDVTVHIAPTPGALTHPVLLHQLEMLRRVVPGWRIVGVAYRDDVTPESDIAAIAASPYHEIRFLDVCRPDRLGAERIEPVALPVLFSRIRTVQAQRGALTPILVRLPERAAYANRGSDHADCSGRRVAAAPAPAERPTAPHP